MKNIYHVGITYIHIITVKPPLGTSESGYKFLQIIVMQFSSKTLN